MNPRHYQDKTKKMTTDKERIEKLEKEIIRLHTEIIRIKRFGNLEPVIGRTLDGKPITPVVKSR